MLASEENLLGLMALNRELVGQAEAFDDSERVVLDMDSTESPVHGQQEGSAYNGHFESVCCGSEVVLTLAKAVASGNTVGLTYEVPDTGAIQDADSLEAVGVTWVTVTSVAPNTAPEITSPGSFDVIENQARVTWLTATDADEGDEVTGWAITGG